MKYHENDISVRGFFRGVTECSSIFSHCNCNNSRKYQKWASYHKHYMFFTPRSLFPSIPAWVWECLSISLVKNQSFVNITMVVGHITNLRSFILTLLKFNRLTIHFSLDMSWLMWSTQPKDFTRQLRSGDSPRSCSLSRRFCNSSTSEGVVSMTWRVRCTGTKWLKTLYHIWLEKMVRLKHRSQMGDPSIQSVSGHVGGAHPIPDHSQDERPASVAWRSLCSHVVLQAIFRS